MNGISRIVIVVDLERWTTLLLLLWLCICCWAIGIVVDCWFCQYCGIDYPIVIYCWCSTLTWLVLMNCWWLTIGDCYCVVVVVGEHCDRPVDLIVVVVIDVGIWLLIVAQRWFIGEYRRWWPVMLPLLYVVVTCCWWHCCCYIAVLLTVIDGAERCCWALLLRWLLDGG